MRSTAAAFIGRPANAPSRSTTWRYSKPCASKACAWAAASRLNTVARAGSPCSRRTHKPSLRSMAGNRITSARDFHFGSRFPLQKVGDERQAEALALFRVELGAGKRIARHHGGDRAAIVGLGHEVGAVVGLELIRVHEIGMPALRSEPEALEQRVRPHLVQRVPPHVRNLQRRIARHDAVDLAGDPAEAGRDFIFAAALCHQLHADADAEKRPAVAAHGFLQRLDHPVDRIQAAATIREGADARQDHAVGATHRVGIARHHDRLVAAGLAHRPLERLGGRVQVAGAVVHDGDAHARAPGWGNSPSTSPGGCAVRGGGTAPGGGGGADAAPAPIQASKKRRSARLRSSATTTPRFFQPLASSSTRRSDAASNPSRMATNSPISAAEPADAPSAPASSNASAANGQAITRPSRKPRNENPTRTNLMRTGSLALPRRPGGGSCTVKTAMCFTPKDQPPSTPLVEGTSPAARGSMAMAVRSARARPLKHDSATWWSLLPYSVSTCSVTPAFMAKAWNHSCTSSVSNAPTLSRPNAALNTRKGRPEMSIATRVSASSMGTCTSA